MSPTARPHGEPRDTPLLVAWHLQDPPRSETAMAAAVPLDGPPAWRVYLGLPMSGSRLPDGRLESFLQLGSEDAVLKVFEPTCRLALEEFPSSTCRPPPEVAIPDMASGGSEPGEPRRVAGGRVLARAARSCADALLSPRVESVVAGREEGP